MPRAGGSRRVAALGEDGLVCEHRERGAIFGTDGPEGTKNDLYRLAQDVFDEKKNFPGIYLSCGEQDGLYASNERFSAHLASLGIAHRFEHWPGAHSWDFWDASLRAALAYFFD